MPTTHATLSDSQRIAACVVQKLQRIVSFPRRFAASSLDDVQISLPICVLIHVYLQFEQSSMLSYITRRQLPCLHVLKQAMHIHVIHAWSLCHAYW